MKNLLIVIVVLIVAVLIISKCEQDKEPVSYTPTPPITMPVSEPTESEDAVPSTTSHSSTSMKTKWDAYGICTQIARNKYGDADFSFGEAYDYGNDDWMIKGFADIQGKRITWTGEVQYEPATDKWEIKGWVDNQ